MLALIPDLLFASRVQAALGAGGHEVRLIMDQRQLGEHLPEADVLIVDLTSHDADPTVLGEPSDSRALTLAFYSHVDSEMRERAQAAGFDLVVPRSRMAREGSELVTRLVSEKKKV